MTALRVAGFVGGVALDLVDEARELYSVFARTLYYVVRGRREPGATVRQMYEIGNRASSSSRSRWGSSG